RERGRGHVAVAAVARGRVRSEIAVRTRVRSGGGRTRDHPEVGGGLVAARTGEAATGHGGVTGERQRRSGDVRGTDLEAAAARIDVAGAVTARAVAVERGDRDVVARSRNDREHRIGGNTEGPGDRLTVAAQARRRPLVGAGGRVEGVVAGSGMALGARRGGR